MTTSWVPRHRAARRQTGAHAAAFAVTVFTLIFTMGLGIDAGRLWIAKSEMQNAADACALAAASALTGGNANQLVVAEDQGITVGQLNRANFQKDAIAFVPNQSVLFSATINGSYQPKNLVGTPTDMKYARCTLDSSAVSYFLFRVVNIVAPGTAVAKVVGSTAVATIKPSITSCAVPIGMCGKGGNAGLSQPNWGWTQGDWMVARQAPGSGWTGAFRWVEFPGYSKTKDLAGLLEGSGQCDLANVASVDSHNGVIQSLVEPWNWRLGVHKNSGQSSPPDYSGYAYTGVARDNLTGANVETAAAGNQTWPPTGGLYSANAYDDFIQNRRPGNTPWNNSPALVGGWQASTTGQHQAGADRRFVTVPVVDCPGLGGGPGSGSSPVYGFACAMLLNPVSSPQQAMGMEFRGDVSQPGPFLGCVTSGLPGGNANGPKVPGLVY